MTLSTPVRAAVLEVVRRLRDPMRAPAVDKVGFMVLDAMPGPHNHHRAHVALTELRRALGLDIGVGTLARWARGKSREEVAQALEKVATPDASER